MFENMELPINKFYKNMFKHSKLKLHKCGDCDYRGTAACDLKNRLGRNAKKHRKQKAA